MTLRLALLDASHGTDHTRRNFRRELDADLAEFDVTSGDLPPDFDYDGVVVTGSRSSVYWDEAWIDDLVDWVARAAERGLPVFGVCYGHQVLAEALGGRVEAMDDIELGYREIERLVDDPLLDGIDTPFVAFETHSDRVVDLPPGATLLAENDRGVQAFRRDDCWGVQFHPEYDRGSAERVTKGKDLPAERIRAVVDDIDDDNYAAACRTKRLFDNFTDYVRERRAVAADD
ncbi:type 1 glutamine amidotransferase [Haloplanus aerogenes]|uniref:GMP synthase (Glutamine-hydrolysing) n=1 Tax=Haloplanus aerogenes TaxID=660522 RepID=A0A3M0CVW8_9EURY|nr:type 1 glutamine amidotransferase [Haloplanus aerogenes]AZH23883.1 type 1 glutamine amidotransferase [Haloplanus aerogenes]RMB13358.1 GMP synthase (glutamine-hydrolysing) [Haloplanus aerogenes]